jgi:two-component system sensor histidine kinase RpfC
MILSADATPAAKQESLEAGADEYLTKPVVSALLFSALERMVAGIPRGEVEQEQPSTAARDHEKDELPTAAVLVDPERIQALRRIARGDEQFLEKYVSAACSEMEQAIGDLRAAISAFDVKNARDALHIIEGTGASIGATALVGNCKSLRNYLRVAQDPECANALAELSANYALAKSVILAHLHNASVSAPRSNAPQ